MKRIVLSAALAALASSVVTVAQATGTDPVVLYPYATSQNYCPAGLQPVSFEGTTSCGKPTTNVTYQQATSSPRAHRGHGGARDCPIGAKGC